MPIPAVVPGVFTKTGERSVRIETMVAVFVNAVFLAMLSGAALIGVLLFFP